MVLSEYYNQDPAAWRLPAAGSRAQAGRERRRRRREEERKQRKGKAR